MDKETNNIFSVIAYKFDNNLATEMLLEKK